MLKDKSDCLTGQWYILSQELIEAWNAEGKGDLEWLSKLWLYRGDRLVGTALNGSFSPLPRVTGFRAMLTWSEWLTSCSSPMIIGWLGTIFVVPSSRRGLRFTSLANSASLMMFNLSEISSISYSEDSPSPLCPGIRSKSPCAYSKIDVRASEFRLSWPRSPFGCHCELFFFSRRRLFARAALTRTMRRSSSFLCLSDRW